MAICIDGQGNRCGADVTHKLLFNGELPYKGHRGMCEKHAREVVDEYRAKLGIWGHLWTIVPCK